MKAIAFPTGALRVASMVVLPPYGLGYAVSCAAVQEAVEEAQGARLSPPL